MIRKKAGKKEGGDPEPVKESMRHFWGIGPGSDAQLAAIAGQLRELSPEQLSLLNAFVPRGVPGTDIGARCERLRDVVAGVLAEG